MKGQNLNYSQLKGTTESPNRGKQETDEISVLAIPMTMYQLQSTSNGTIIDVDVMLL